MSSKSNIISAVAALSKIAEIRQFGLAQDYSHLLAIELVNKINNDAKNATDIDLLNFSKKLTIEEIAKYEEFLDKVVNNNLTQKLSNAFLADELELLSTTKPFSLHSFKSFEMKPEYIANLVKSVLNPLGILTSSIIPIVKSCHRVQVMGEDQDNFLSLSKTVVRGKQVLALFHVLISKRDQAARVADRIPPNLEKAYNNSPASRRTASRVVFPVSCFLISPENPLLDEDSLVHLFLQAVLKYGRNTTIGDQTRKFFLKGFSSSLLINTDQQIKLVERTGGVVNGSLEIEKTPTGYKYSFAYNAAVDSMLHDYKRGQFIL